MKNRVLSLFENPAIGHCSLPVRLVEGYFFKNPQLQKIDFTPLSVSQNIEKQEKNHQKIPFLNVPDSTE